MPCPEFCPIAINFNSKKKKSRARMSNSKEFHEKLENLNKFLNLNVLLNMLTMIA